MIPKTVREASGMDAGTRLKITMERGGRIVLEPIRGFTKELAGSAKGMLKGRGAVSYVRALRDERL